LEALTAAISVPGIPMPEVTRLQKEILDLQVGRQDSSPAPGQNPSF
jgi:hypothetical protein